MGVDVNHAQSTVRVSLPQGSRRDQEEGGGAGPSSSPRRDHEQGGGIGLRKLDFFRFGSPFSSKRLWSVDAVL